MAKKSDLKEGSVKKETSPIKGQLLGGETSSGQKSEFKKEDTSHTAGLYSLSKARDEKNKAIKDDEDEELKQATEDARVLSYIIKDNKKMICTLDDFFEDKIIFSLATEGILATNRIKLDLSFQYQKKDQKLICEADVESVDRDEEGTHYVTVAISKENIKSFESFIKLYQKRQENVDVFLKRVKGF